jgi:hypothetical protein
MALKGQKNRRYSGSTFASDGIIGGFLEKYPISNWLKTKILLKQREFKKKQLKGIANCKQNSFKNV